MKRITFALTCLLFFCIQGFTAGVEKYERKSISYVNALWLATPKAKEIKPQQVNYMLTEVKKQIEMPRFDFNPLPERLIRDFVDAANKKESLSVGEIAALMQKKLVPTITGILEGAMTQRAGELVSEESRQTFMATKAKELGITLEEIEKVMNSAFIYLPVLSSIERTESKTKGKFSCKITGGIIWFQVIMSGDSPQVVLKVSQTTESSGFGSDQFAYESAVRNFARNLTVATRSIPEFKLGAAIVEVLGRSVTFPMGTREGIHIDDIFFVGETVLDEKGDLSFERSGWVRVGKVGENRTNSQNRSSAWAVKYGSWVPGMSLVEHPRLGIDISPKPMLYTMSVGTGRIPVLGDAIRIENTFEGFAWGMDVDAHINIANIFKSRQLFFLIGGNFAVLPGLEFTSSSAFTNMTTTPPFTWGFHGGLMKKFCFGQYAMTVDAKAGARYFTVIQDFTLGLIDYTYTIENNSAGFQFDIGFDYAVSPDVNLGLIAGYRAYTVSDAWTLSIDPDVGTVVVSDDLFPEINHSGLAFGIYFHYTPPALPFDPVDLFRGVILDE